MVVYYCDGSISDGKVGIGIVRRDNEVVQTFSYEIEVMSNERVHEVMAVTKVLEIALANKDVNFTIFNDDLYLVKRLKDRKYQNRKYRNSELEDIRITLEKCNACVKYPTERESLFIQKAHDLSRTYVKGEIYQSAYLESFKGLEFDKGTKVKERIQKEQLDKQINTNALKSASKLLLTKYSKKGWVALTQKEEPIFACKDIVVFAETVLSYATKLHKTLSVNESFLKVFLETMNSGTIIEANRKEMANSIRNLLMSPTIKLYKLS